MAPPGRRRRAEPPGNVSHGTAPPGRARDGAAGDGAAGTGLESPGTAPTDRASTDPGGRRPAPGRRRRAVPGPGRCSGNGAAGLGLDRPRTVRRRHRRAGPRPPRGAGPGTAYSGRARDGAPETAPPGRDSTAPGRHPCGPAAGSVTAPREAGFRPRDCAALVLDLDRPWHWLADPRLRFRALVTVAGGPGFILGRVRACGGHRREARSAHIMSGPGVRPGLAASGAAQNTKERTLQQRVGPGQGRTGQGGGNRPAGQGGPGPG